MEKPAYVIRDPIHGLIELSQKELDLINTRGFQRLRRIRQLAMAFLVYPGALHTRFDHSIGVMHIAGRICEQLKQHSEIDVECDQVRLAALLHDIGHGPFSHVSEHLLDQYVGDKASSGAPREKIHEKVTVDIIKNDSEICAVLSDKEREFVVEMIEGKKEIEGETEKDFRRDIVSSDLDADKMDYLLRDSYFAGVKYGMYDLDKMIESCRVHQDGNESILAISDEGIYALEQLLLAKHHMTQQVYHHRVRSIADSMIVRGIEIGIREHNPVLNQLYMRNEAPDFIQNYMDYHDERLIGILRHCEQEKTRIIFDRLYGRVLFKMIGELPLKEVKNAIARKRLAQIDDKNGAGGKQQRRWENRIAEHLKIDSDFVIVKRLQIRNPNYGSRSYSFSPDAIMIFDEKHGVPRNLSSYTTELVIVRLPPEEVALDIVQVYAPRDHWNTLSLTQRRQERLRLQEAVQEILLSP